jgi:mRNA-degrading endonuclease YafQ of YafQ-DinJ toxin-antitoxin module
MKIVVQKTFLKAFVRLDKRSQLAVEAALAVFVQTPFAKELRNHELKGRKYAGARSIDAGFDLRIIFRELSNGKYEVVSLATMGTHSKLYG